MLKWALHLATPDLLQLCSHCVAEGRPGQQVNSPPRPEGNQLQLKSKHIMQLLDELRAKRLGPVQWVLLDQAAHQHVPDVLAGSLVAAEANAGAQQALSSPHVAGHHLQLTHPGAFSAVHLHLHCFLHVGLQDLLQQLIFLILAHSKNRGKRSNCSYKWEKSFCFNIIWVDLCSFYCLTVLW